MGDYGAGAAQAAAQSAAASKITTIEGKDPKQFKGLVTPGNLDVYRRPILNNADGSYSTTSSASFHDDRTGLEVLIPTVIGGKRYSESDAWQHYLQTGENLGSFDTPDNADKYATALHDSQAKMDEIGSKPTAPPLTYTQPSGLAPILDRQVQALVAASGGKIYVKSAVRTTQQQAQLYDAAAARYGEANAYKWVAQPGDSNHEKGAAVDLGGDLSVIQQLAPQFGLAAPMAWEPWHLEMGSTKTHAQPTAYTQGPPGSQNPTEADFSQDPQHVAANVAESLLGLTNSDGTGTAGFSNSAADPLGAILDTAPLGTGGLAPEGPQGPSTEGSTGGANNTGKGNVDPKQLYSALSAAGLPPAAAAAFVSIAGRESGYNTGAHNGNAGTGDDSYGLFQVNLLNGGWTDFLKAHGLSNPAQDLTTLRGSVQAAKAIYDSSGLHPWGGYRGMPWWNGTNLDAGASASGGQVSVADMQALGGG